MYTASGKMDSRALMDEYLPIVRRQAQKLAVHLPANIDVEDLIQAGVVGLLDAHTRYDPSMGTAFGGFAAQRIYGAMIDELRLGDWLPRRTRMKQRHIDKTIRELEQKLGRAPVEEEIASAVDMDIDTYRQTLHDTNAGALFGLEELIATGDDPTADSDFGGLDESIAAGQMKERLVEAIKLLPEREKLLMTLYYQEELYLKEIGVVMGVSEGRVCQIHSQAVARLRAALEINIDRE